ncbi:MAG: hypothetical protein EP330_14640 [Deltaproteobacteria bacterium]|nr:MAG: hypothetical protein EP330_14640 [Deltaproteobacteria bacterium]
MRTSVFAISLALTLAACGKKTTPEPAAAAAETSEPAPAVAEAMTVAMPAGADAKKFTQNLVDANIRDFKPTGTGGSVQFVYKTLDFAGNGTWSADASVEANFEEIPCKESGTWTVEAVDSAQVGTITWTVDKTSCAMREGGESTRGQVTLGKGDEFTVAFR